MFVMIPLMLAARKIDGENPNTIMLLRVGYAAVQFVIVCCISYIYLQASKMESTPEGKKIVYISPPAQPFADPNAKKKYTETSYGSHIIAAARSLIGSTFFGILITFGLHIYRGIVVGIAMQIVMGPLGLVENPLVKLFLLGGKKVFEEKTQEELTPDDEVVDSEGNKVIVGTTKGKGAKKKAAIAAASKEKKEEKKSFEDILLDTWDMGSESDIGPLMEALNKSNIHFATSDNGWAPIMIMSGLGAKGSGSALKQMKALGADPEQRDLEGWNALHWAAFHGSADAAKVLLADSDWKELKLETVKDKEGMTPLEHAEAEDNKAVAKIISDFIAENPSVEEVSAPEQEGLRKRK